MLSDANTMAANSELLLLQVHQGFNVFRHIPCIVSDIPNPDLLNPMQIGKLHDLQKWIFQFMKTHERLYKYIAISLSMFAYHDLTPKTMSSEEISQLNGMEMKEMSRYLLGVVIQSLRGRSPSQISKFNHSIECTRAWLEFSMYAQY